MFKKIKFTKGLLALIIIINVYMTISVFNKIESNYASDVAMLSDIMDSILIISIQISSMAITVFFALLILTKEIKNKKTI